MLAEFEIGFTNLCCEKKQQDLAVGRVPGTAAGRRHLAAPLMRLPMCAGQHRHLAREHISTPCRKGFNVVSFGMTSAIKLNHRPQTRNRLYTPALIFCWNMMQRYNDSADQKFPVYFKLQYSTKFHLSYPSFDP